MDDMWQCEVCGALNNPGMPECYKCGTPRLIPPIPGTRIYDQAPTPADHEDAPASSMQPEEPGPAAPESGRGPSKPR
jgi:hypothetical protein